MSTAMVPPARSFLNGTTGATPSRTEAVLDAIKRAILAGELRPGQNLVETELAQLLGVSKTPVREALKTLAGAGLVTMSAYRGATVRAIDPASAAAIYDLRLLLEPEAVRRAVGRGAAEASPVQAWASAHAALQASDAATDQAQRSLANREFHRALYLACGNSLLVKTLDDLRDQTALVSALSWEQAPSWQQEAAEHQAILAAARRGAATEAAALLRAHIAGFADRHFPMPARAAVAPATEWSTDEH
ncbi:MAG TPA: GntR family transcriptional regulator [Streptosporangiaceae bacterium]|nr:GntR family transcriptional regulator [Streptosporangiaceae bacterium]